MTSEHSEGGREELSYYLEFTQTVTIVAPSVASHCGKQMATANSIDQILRDLLVSEGCNKRFSDDLPAGDEDVLSAAVPSLSKDSFEMENILDSVKSLPMPTGPVSIHRKFADKVSQARVSAIPAKTCQDTVYCV